MGLQNARAAYAAFAAACLPCLAAWMQTEGIPLSQQRCINFSPQGQGYHDEFILVARPWMLLYRHLTDIAALPQTEQCVSQHRAEGVIPISDVLLNAMSDDGLKQYYMHRLFEPLAHALQNLDGMPPSLEMVMHSYEVVQAEWLSPERTWHIIAPLLNVDAAIDSPAALGEGCAFTPFTGDERMATLNSIGPLALVDSSLYGRASIALTATFADTYPFGSGRANIIAEFTQVVTTLRLSKPGAVTMPVALERMDSVAGEASPDFRRTVLWVDNHRPPSEGVTPYTLTPGDMLTIRQTFAALKDAIVQKHMAVALRRFNQSYARLLPEDRLIDLAIVLETLLGGGERGELTYKIAMRGTAAVAAAHAHGDVRGFLTSLYNVRSKIVHDGKTLSDIRIAGTPVDDYPQRCEDLIRTLVSVYIKRLVQQHAEDEEARRRKEKASTDSPIKRVIADLDAEIANALASGAPTKARK